MPDLAQPRTQSHHLLPIRLKRPLPIATPHAPCPSPSPFAFAIQGVRALPSFHFWKGSKQVDSISGAKAQTLQDAIETHMN